MSSSSKAVNAKSQSLTARIPHEVMEGMESVKNGGESTAAFVVTAMRGEIARRQLSGTAEDALASARDVLANVRDSASKAGKEIEAIIRNAEKEIGGSTASLDTPPAEEDKPAVKPKGRTRMLGS